MTRNEAENLRGRLSELGIDAWLDEIVPTNRHGWGVCFRGYSNPLDTVVTVGARIALTPEEGERLLEELAARR